MHGPAESLDRRVRRQSLGRELRIVLAASLLLMAAPYFKICIVDAESGRGVPLVELKTVNGLRFVTDSAGLVAFQEPGLMGREVYFHVWSHGYEMPADSFGYRGVALRPKAGASATVRIQRLNIAQRLVRLTGGGIYRDSVLLGEKTPLRDPVLTGGVMGQDTAQAEIYRGKMMWFWGDTDRTGFPLGNFHTTGAIATLPKGGADLGIEYRYFTRPDGFVRSMVESKETQPIWVSGLAVLGSGKDESLYAYYAQMHRLGEIAASGYLKWNDTKERFDIVQTFDGHRGWRFLDGHLVKHEGTIGGNLPVNVRVADNPPSLLDAEAYEAFTPLDENGKVKRVDGKPDYRWQKALPPLSAKGELELVRSGELKPEEAWFLPRDEKGETILPHGGSVHWNGHRKRWIMVFTRLGGKDSELGEIYYSEGPSPSGPFRRAVKILTHDRYTFYNPVHHAFLDKGNAIYLEGTYTAEFPGNDDKTPLYNYNQILYKLNLDDSRLTFARE